MLQPLAERVRRDTGTDFVVVMTPDGIRYSHPNPAEIGGHFRGTIAPAAAGGTVVETFTGTLGPSVRAVVPVVVAGRVTGLVAVGQTVTRVSGEMTRQLPLLVGTTAVALVLAGAGSWLASRWLRRTTHDLGPAELSRMYEYYDAVLHAVREGLLLLDRAGRVQLLNDEARRLLALPDDAVGRHIDELGLPAALAGALASGAERADEIFLTDDRVVVVSQAAARWAGQQLGSVVTLRDHTELRALVSELKTIRGFAEALSRAGARVGEPAADRDRADRARPPRGRAAVRRDRAGRRPAPHRRRGEPDRRARAGRARARQGGRGGGAWRRAAGRRRHRGALRPRRPARPRDDRRQPARQRGRRGVRIRHGRAGGRRRPLPTGRGWVRAEAGTLAVDGVEELEIVVADSGPGLGPDAAAHAFERGWTTKPTDRPLGRGIGLALVAQAVHRLGGSIDVANEVGAVFSVRLPRPSVSLPAAQAPVADPAAPARIAVDVPG